MPHQPCEPAARTPVGPSISVFSPQRRANGNCAATFTTTVSGTQELRITARGDPAAGVWPQAKVYVNGGIVATWDIIDDEWLTYVAPIDVASGSHSVAIHFVNDAIVNGDDRNLHLDRAVVRG